MTQLGAYRSEVERHVSASPTVAERSVRNATLKNLSTLEVLLSVLELQQRALADDFTCQLYNVLLEHATCNLVDVAQRLGFPVSSPHMTFRVMQLVKRTVEARRQWVNEQLDLRRKKVHAYVAGLNKAFQALLQRPMRRSVSNNVQRGQAAVLLATGDDDGDGLSPAQPCGLFSCRSKSDDTLQELDSSSETARVATRRS